MTNEEKLAAFKPHLLLVGILKSGGMASVLCIDKKSIETAIKTFETFRVFSLTEQNTQFYIDKLKE